MKWPSLAERAERSAEEVLSSVRVDDFEFIVTASDIEENACMLWARKAAVEYDALGWFSPFDLRCVLGFITRYATSEDMRREVEHRRFEQWVSSLSPRSVLNLDMQFINRANAELVTDADAA